MPRFFIQEHHARRLHWDLRIEVGGTLKSWALPKGPPFAAGIRHLAIATPDHPLAYGSFHGVIPKGRYGAGTVDAWDRGEYRCLSAGTAGALDEGRLDLVLYGARLRGRFVLVRTNAARGTWLMLKLTDARTRRPAATGGR